MRIVNVETFLVGNPWKNWLFVRILTDEGLSGVGEGSLGHLSKTVETAVHVVPAHAVHHDLLSVELKC